MSSAVKISPSPFASDAFHMALTYKKAGNLTEEVKLYRVAAEHGHPGAMNELGVCLMNAPDRETHEAEARKLFLEAAGAGHKTAMYNFALMCRDGQGGPQNHQAFLEWGTQAASYGNVRAHQSLGEYYMKYGRNQKERLMAVHHLSYALAKDSSQSSDALALAIKNLS